MPGALPVPVPVPVSVPVAAPVAALVDLAVPLPLPLTLPVSLPVPVPGPVPVAFPVPVPVPQALAVQVSVLSGCSLPPGAPGARLQLPGVCPSGLAGQPWGGVSVPCGRAAADRQAARVLLAAAAAALALRAAGVPVGPALAGALGAWLCALLALQVDPTQAVQYSGA